MEPRSCMVSDHQEYTYAVTDTYHPALPQLNPRPLCAAVVDDAAGGVRRLDDQPRFDAQYQITHHEEIVPIIIADVHLRDFVTSEYDFLASYLPLCDL